MQFDWRAKLLARCYYFDGQSVYDSKGSEATHIPAYAVVFVTSQCYLADQRQLPGTGKELGKAIKLYKEHQKPFPSPLVVADKQQKKETSSLVNFFYLTESAVATLQQKLQSSCFIIPEELLLQHQHQGAYELAFNGYRLSSAQLGMTQTDNPLELGELVSQQQYQVINSVQQWLQMLVEFAQPKHVLLLGQCQLVKQNKNFIEKYEQALTLTLLGVCLYGAASAGFLIYQQYDIETHMQAQKEQQQQLITAQSEYQNQLDTYNSIRAPFQTPPQVALAIAALSDAYKQAEFDIERVNYTKELFRVTGKAEDAVAVFEAFNQHPNMHNVAYITPTVKRGKLATFNISFTTTPGEGL
ncbi:hypothetical protein [Pseudoalteromonas ruthenica]|uniref:hypothetical protein n=1 Tax=Pseudoalteromonas ruthenica TaxID=151081 RepID=UPI0012463031|nr:hypothetical protein [Pseudoalteromonas ruthenica]|tara:strand:+ start:27315 stop:28382 length:1068 start_codon:yes stop_codon:yes gene_type:complete